MPIFGRGLPIKEIDLDIQSFLANLQLRGVDGTVYPLFVDYANQRIGIGTLSPSSSAKLEISSTTSGFLPPRMTSNQRAAITPVVGLMVFDTDMDNLMVYKSSGWAICG